jgi:hypothetical protein
MKDLEKSASSSVASGLRSVMEKVDKSHITQVIDIAKDVLKVHGEMAKQNHDLYCELSLIEKNLRNDLTRGDAATEKFILLAEGLPTEVRGEIVKEIIFKILGK